MRCKFTQFMKYTTTAAAAYESPECWAVELDVQGLVCTSPTGQGNETYEEGDPSGWFNN